MYIYLPYLIHQMDLASGVPLLHHGTASWETFLSVHSNWMPLLKPPVTHWGRRLSWEVFCSARKVVSIILFSEKKCDFRRERLHGSSGATYCVGTRSYGRHVMPGVSAPRLFRPNKATFCVHRKTPYNISTWFVGQKETGVLAKWDNPCIFPPPAWPSETLSGLFWRDISSSVFYVLAQFLGL